MCSVNIHTVFQIFISEINALHEYKDRLYIRVLSISGLWDINLERFLDTFWGVENNIRLSVAPLRQEDVSTICKNRNIDSDEFLKIVIEKGLQPLAIIPYSLSQLLETELSQIYRDELSSDELYYNSCMILSESSVSKIKNRDFISSNKMIAIAARIAAIMAFCRKDFVTIYKLDSNRVDTLLVSEIFEEEETTGEYNFTILHRDIIETIIFSGLFYKNSDGRFSFYHQAFQDYLAAKFIINHEYDNEKVISLLTNSKDREGKLFEWIRGVNTWLQNITPRIDILKFFISHDPLKVLNGRIINDDQIKEELVKSILEKFNNAEIIDNEWGLLSNNGHKLLHSKMAEQILPYISGKENHILARRNAMEMAEACNLVELQEPLWKIVSDNTEDIHVREQAMSSLSKLVDDDQILSKLVKVATTDDKSDENDGLKGYALNITWNKRIISVEEIFNSLTKPKKDSFVGIYKAFIEFLLPRELDIKDFVVALEWMRKNIDELYDSLSVFSRLVSRILQLGWENYNSLDNKDQFVDTVRLILIQHHPIFPVRDSFFDTDENVYEVPKEVRFEVIDKLLAHCKNDEFYNFDFFSSRLILHDEFENAVQYCKGSNNIELWKRILCYFSYENQERVSFLRTSFPEDVDGVFSFIFTPRTIDINRKIKEKAQQEKRAKDEKDALELIEKKILECISKYSETKDPFWNEI